MNLGGPDFAVRVGKVSPLPKRSRAYVASNADKTQRSGVRTLGGAGAARNSEVISKDGVRVWDKDFLRRRQCNKDK